MVNEEKTTRIISKNEHGKLSYSCKRSQRNLADFITVIGYAEVKKGYPFDKKETEEGIYEYIDNHPAVHYVKWFEDRLEGDY